MRGWCLCNGDYDSLITMYHNDYGGERGIRTLGTSKGTTDFESAPFDHSGTSPKQTIILNRNTFHLLQQI